MPSIFEKISEVLRGGSGKGKQIPSPPNSLISAPVSIEENTTPSPVVEDAMSLASFQQVVEENDKKLKELSKIPIEYLTNYLRAIIDDDKRSKTADILLKELHGVERYYQDSGDQAVVGRIVKALQPFASQKINNAIKFSNLFPIHISKATLLPELFDNFTEAFRWKKEIVEDKIQNPSTRFKP